MKTLVTHINPHLDDIVAIWLYKKFHPDFKDAEVKFIPASVTGTTWKNQPVDSKSDIIHLGVGRGKFDEHKGNLEDCAASLVWLEIKSKELALKDKIEKAALEELVDWVKVVDLGRLPQGPYDDFIVPAFIRPKDNKIESSEKAVELGGEILDRIFRVLRDKQQDLKDWEKRVEFKSRFGKSFAVASETINRPFCARAGGNMFLMYSPKNGSVQYFTPVREIDLKPIYQKVKSLDPKADWYLHHSHHMVLCGSSSAPNSKKTKLTFKQLIDAAKQA